MGGGERKDERKACYGSIEDQQKAAPDRVVSKGNPFTSNGSARQGRSSSRGKEKSTTPELRRRGKGSKGEGETCGQKEDNSSQSFTEGGQAGGQKGRELRPKAFYKTLKSLTIKTISARGGRFSVLPDRNFKIIKRR